MTGALYISRFSLDPQLHLADEDQTVARSRNGTTDVDQVAFGVHALDAQIAHGLLCRAHLTRHLLALDHARRVRARPERARIALLRVTVARRPAAEPVTLDHTLEATALRRAGHPDAVALLELIDLQLLTQLVALDRVDAKLAERARRVLQTRTLRMALRRLRCARLAQRVES